MNSREKSNFESVFVLRVFVSIRRSPSKYSVLAKQGAPHEEQAVGEHPMREIHPLRATRRVDAECSLDDTQRPRALVSRARHRLVARGEIEQRSNEQRSERHDGGEKCGEFDVECVHAH